MLSDEFVSSYLNHKPSSHISLYRESQYLKLESFLRAAPYLIVAVAVVIIHSRVAKCLKDICWDFYLISSRAAGEQSLARSFRLLLGRRRIQTMTVGPVEDPRGPYLVARGSRLLSHFNLGIGILGNNPVLCVVTSSGRQLSSSDMFCRFRHRCAVFFSRLDSYRLVGYRSLIIICFL